MIYNRQWLLEIFGEELADVCDKYDCWPKDIIRKGKLPPVHQQARYELIDRMRDQVGWKWNERTTVFCDPSEGAPLQAHVIADLVNITVKAVDLYVNRKYKRENPG